MKINVSRDILTDCNHHERRFFRCWIDGSYNGEGHYRHNCDLVRQHWDNPKGLRALAISEWLQYQAQENECSTSTVHRHMMKQFTRDELEALNLELVDELRDLVRDDINDRAT